jgi:hypothetical protein
MIGRLFDVGSIVAWRVLVFGGTVWLVEETARTRADRADYWVIDSLVVYFVGWYAWILIRDLIHDHPRRFLAFAEFVSSLIPARPGSLTHNEKMQRDPAYREAFHQWRRETHEHNLRIPGPIRESQSIGDTRWPFNDHDARLWRESERQRAHLRARGYTFPVVGPPMSEDAWRAWGERERERRRKP